MKLVAPVLLAILSAPLPGAATELERLRPESVLHGFRAEAVYVNELDRPIGARFRHEATGFVFDLLRIESLPQAFVYVNSLPTSDMGEPHTQEHLLLGKGNVGRAVGGLQTMTLTASSAFTEQWRTCYHWNTAGGAEAYHEVFERQLDALLHPDYTDEEIRREVRNIGVTDDGKGGLRLEEKGTVYNEMVSSSDRPARRLFRELGRLLYGPAHPLSYDSGGWPAAIRRMKPEDIRAFHRRAYRLGNMGMVGAFPASMPLESILARADESLLRLERKSTGRSRAPFESEADFPPPAPEKEGTLAVVEFPHQNEQTPGDVIFAWPPTADLPLGDRLLAGFFLDAFSGDASTNLYRIFVDSRTRELETGATGAYGWVSTEKGHVLYLGLDDVAADRQRPEILAKIRERIATELAAVAAWADGSPELAAFNERVRSRIVEHRRDLSTLVNSPPRFGFRGAGSSWMKHLHDLASEGGFRRSVALSPALEAIGKELDSGRNVWRRAIERWGLLSRVPFGVGVRPSSELMKKDEAERKERLAAEADALRKRYATSDVQDAIRRYREDYDRDSAALSALASETRFPPFVASPPMTLDEPLAFAVRKVRGVPLVASRFENVTRGTAGLALRLDGVSGEDLTLLSLLPDLLTRSGVIENGKPVSYEAMAERLRREILLLDADFSTNPTTGRVELRLRGSGNDAAETVRALGWMELVLHHPDWRTENLDRIRDVVDQAWNALRNTMQRSEEGWVEDPADAWRFQDDPLYLATDSFLTRSAAAHRLRWLLRRRPAGAAGEALDAWLGAVSALSGSRIARLELLANLPAGAEGETPPASHPVLLSFRKLPPEAKTVAIEIAKDLRQVLDDVPDSSLDRDFTALVAGLSRDLATPPEATLARLDRLRRKLLARPRARLFSVGSSGTEKALAGPIASLVGRLAEGAPLPKPKRAGAQLLTARLREREPGASSRFVGLVVPHLKGGVFVESAPFVGFRDASKDRLLDYLASRLFVGYGSHGIFMKTWGAGLAYSNGFRGSLSRGDLGYYAERTPELPQTMKFVTDLLRGAAREPALAEYAVSQAFQQNRAGDTYEARAEAIAADLADGLTPDVVRAFRKKVLELRKSPDLAAELFDRMPRVYGTVLPGLVEAAAPVEGARSFVLGPESQIAAWERYLKTVVGPDAEVERLHPRDFWLAVDRPEGR